MKSAHTSRTMWFAYALVILGVVFDNFSYVQNLIDPRVYGVSYIVIGVFVGILRLMTTQGIK